MHRLGIGITVAVAIALGCSNRTDAGAATASAKSNQNWQRMKECADQADRVTRRYGWVEGQADSVSQHGVMGWENHYSAKYERCYLVANFMIQEADAKNQLPLLYLLMYDAFETRIVAQCSDMTTGNAAAFCEVSQPGEQSSRDCPVCRRFFKERMEN